MAAILIDYENVNGADGLKGVDCLESGDSLYLFYSGACSKVRAEHMRAIEESACGFFTFRLANPGKNALDFYIAAQCGMLVRGGCGQIAIVSRDKGFHAVADFFRLNREVQDVRVAVAPNVETGLMLLNDPEGAGRRRLLHERARMLDIEAGQARIQERRRMEERIRNAFAGTEYEAILPQILGYADGCWDIPPRVLYPKTLHEFGRADGTAIYRTLKSITRDSV